MRFAILLLTVFSAVGGWAQAPDSATTMATARQDIQVLCADSLAGRGYNHGGHTKAAAYLAARYRQLGAKPYHGTGYQPFSFQLNYFSHALLQVDGEKLAYGKDFIANGNTRVSKGSTRLVNVGYGLPGDWPADAVKGSIVVVREGLPAGHNLPDSIAAEIKTDAFKAAAAKYLQATAVIILKKKLTASFGQAQGDIVIFEALEQNWPQAPKHALFSMPASVITQRSGNVIFAVPGAVSPDTAIVLSAHYDHLGQVGDAIFRGASDNASGTAFLLALATQLLSNPPRYTTIFLATGAEEVGLIGSQHYVSSLIGRQDTTLGTYILGCLNFDLMGNGQKGVVAVAGKAYPALFGAIDAANKAGEWLPDIRPQGNRPNSDHWYFTQAGIPALFFFTEGGQPNYHDIFDTPDQLELPVFWRFSQLIVSFLRSPGLSSSFKP